METKLLAIAAVLARRLSSSDFAKNISRTSAGLRGATDDTDGCTAADSNVLFFLEAL